MSFRRIQIIGQNVDWIINNDTCELVKVIGRDDPFNLEKECVEQ